MKPRLKARQRRRGRQAPSQFRGNLGHEIVDDLAILLVLELIGKLQAQLADIRKNRIREELLQNIVRGADDISGKESAALALRRERALMATGSVFGIAFTGSRVGAVERHDDATKCHPPLRPAALTIGLKLAGLRDEEIVSPLARR